MVKTSTILDDIKYYYDCCKIGCIQIFLQSPKQRRGKISKESMNKLTEISNYCLTKNINIYVHAPYTINIGMKITNEKSKELDWWISSLVNELKIANELKMKAVVLHVGKYVNQDEKDAINNMKIALNIIFNYLKELNIELLLENPAGQGTELLSNFDDFLDFYKNLNKEMTKKIFLCIDTCHLFASGTDLRTLNDVDNVMNKIDTTVGLNSIHLVHLNDAEYDLNSKRDRHYPIGKGYIGIKGLRQIYSWMKKYNINVILETPSNLPEKEFKLLIGKK